MKNKIVLALFGVMAFVSIHSNAAAFQACGTINNNIRPGVPEKGGDADLRVFLPRGGSYVLTFGKNPALAGWLQARIPIAGCIGYNGRTLQGFEGLVIEAETFSYR